MTGRPGDLALTCATGTRRRLQALVVAGWPPPRLSAELGAGRTEAARLLRSRKVAVRTARRVAALYDRLWNVDPATCGATREGIRRAKARATAAGWAPASAWDDDRIDDPAALPDWTGHCGTAKGVALHAKHDIPLCPPCQGAINRRRLRAEAHARRALTTTHA